MLYTVPDYYKEFQCLADACEDTCCAGWQIVIDKKSLKKYKEEKSDFGKRLRRSVDFKEGVFKQSEDKRCAFLNQNNLCDMQLALGEKSLCNTCRRYPRHIEEFENVREITLSLSCPEVARILLNRKEKVNLLSVERSGEEEYEEFDPFLYFQLTEGREVMRKILQERKPDIWTRVGLVLGIAHDMQVRIYRRELFSCDEVFEKYQKASAVRFVEKKLENKKKNRNKSYDWAQASFAKLYRLELLHSNWEDHLKETEYLLYGNGAKEWIETEQEYVKWMNENMPDWQIVFEQIMVYFIDTYFCGAVYDGNAYAKARMAADSLFYLYEMFVARWKKNRKMLDMEDIIMITYRYSRELEHSDKNLEELEKIYIYRKHKKTL